MVLKQGTGLAPSGGSGSTGGYVQCSGSGREGAVRWLVQAVAVATAAAKVTQGFAMGGRK